MDKKIEVRVIRSRRRTMAIQIKPEGVIVRAPLFVSSRDVERFVNEHEDWIIKHVQKMEEEIKHAETQEKLSLEEIKELAARAKKVIPERVRYYAPLIGVTYGRITIRHQKTRWGSCSAKGNLNFNCLLMLTPPEAVDSVVVHELCHRKEMNHSRRFYAEVLKVFPDYYKWNRWLKKNGRALLAKLQ